MRIAIIGAGTVGTTLGGRFAAAGHDVVYGVRDPGKVEGGLALADAVAGAHVVVNALPFGAVEEVFTGLDTGTAVLVDAANPLTPMSGDEERARTESGAERLARWSGSTRVVKAFNTTGAENMADPAYPAGPAAMFVAADDAEAKTVVLGLAAEIGFDAIDAGPLAAARDLEHVACVWIRNAIVLGQGRTFAFAVHRR